MTCSPNIWISCQLNNYQNIFGQIEFTCNVLKWCLWPGSGSELCNIVLSTGKGITASMIWNEVLVDSSVLGSWAVLHCADSRLLKENPPHHFIPHCHFFVCMMSFLKKFISSPERLSHAFFAQCAIPRKTGRKGRDAPWRKFKLSIKTGCRAFTLSELHCGCWGRSDVCRSLLLFLACPLVAL